MRPPNIPFTPGARPRSTRRVEKPLRARVNAAAEPAGPAPTTMTSKRSTLSRSHCGKAGRVKGFPPGHAIGIGCSSNSQRSWPCAAQESSSQRSSFPTRRRPIPAIQPARKWHTGFFEGPYALAIGLLCLATVNRPRSGSKWMISVRPHPVSADASMIRFAPSIVSGRGTPPVNAPRNFRPVSELRSPARYRIPLADPPTVCSSCLWMLTMTSARRMRHAWSERRRIPDFGSGWRAAARSSLASCGSNSVRSICGLTVEAFRSRAGIEAIPSSSGNGPSDGHRCKRFAIESFHLSAFPDNVQPGPSPTVYYPPPVLDGPAMPEPAKQDASKPLTVDERVGLDKFEFDEEPFITVDTDVCRTCDTKPCLYVCPSKVYRLDKGELVYNTEGCIELGACAIVCKHLGKDAIHWNYPRGSYGVEFRFG